MRGKSKAIRRPEPSSAIGNARIPAATPRAKRSPPMRPQALGCSQTSECQGNGRHEETRTPDLYRVKERSNQLSYAPLVVPSV